MTLQPSLCKIERMQGWRWPARSSRGNLTATPDFGELVGGQQIGSSSGSEKTPTDETKVAFACILILQNQRVITNMMCEYVASHAVDSDGLLEFSDVDEKMLILEGSFRASTVHEDAMAKLVVGDPKS